MLTNQLKHKENMLNRKDIDLDLNRCSFKITTAELAVVTESTVSEIMEDINLGLIGVFYEPHGCYIAHDEIVNYLFGVYGENADYYLARLAILENLIITKHWDPDTPYHVKNEDIDKFYNSI